MFIGGTVIPASAYQESPVCIPGGSAPFVPTDIAGCLLWLAGDKITGLSDGDPVSSWVDSSGNGNNAVQASGGLQPSYQTNELNSLPIVRFGTSGATNLVSLFTITNRTVFIVNLQGSPAGGQNDGLCDDATTNAGALFFRQSTNGSLIGFFAGGAISATIGSPLAWHTFCLACPSTGTGADLLVDGSSVGTGAVGAPATNGLNIGSRVSGAPFYWTGDIAEIIAYNSVLSSPDIATVQAYINAKYAL